MVEYGATRTLGTRTYSVSGFESSEAATDQIYSSAAENGDWSPRRLRCKWWQLWRPTEHSHFERRIMAKLTTRTNGGES